MRSMVASGAYHPALLNYGAATVAGELAESKHCRLIGAPDNAAIVSKADRARLEWMSAQLLDPEAFCYFARSRAQLVRDSPDIWQGVCDLAETVNDGFWPMPDEKDVGVYEREMSGATAEGVLRRAGVLPGMLG
jgi:hypothetical protein